MSMFGDIGLGVATGGMYNMNKALFGGMFGGGSAPDFSGLIAQRQKQIDSFQNQLTLAQNNVMGNYQNLQTNTMNRFMPDLTGFLAGRGLSPNGGAFASAVAHEATGLQGQYDAMNANMTENNLNTIGSMESQLFGQTLGLQTYPQMANYQQRMGMQQAFGQLAGTALGAGLGGSFGGMFGGQLGRNLFGGSNSGGSGLFNSPNLFSQNRNLNLPMVPQGGGGFTY